MFKLLRENLKFNFASFSLLFLFATSGFAAQEVGIYGSLHSGLAVSRLSTSGPQENRRGLIFGGGVEIPLGELFFLQPELTYVEKGTRASLSAINSAGISDSIVKYDFLDIPVLVKKRFGTGEFMMDILAGPYLGYALTRAAVSESSTGTVTTTDMASSLATIDYGFVIGVGGTFRMSADASFYIQGRYSKGLAALNTTTVTVGGSSVSLSMNAISLMFGYQVLL